MIRVALADDQALVRSGFAALLDAEDDISVVGSAADGFAAVRLARSLRPDALLMGIRMPGLDGIAATRENACLPELACVRVVILTTFGLDEYIFDALRAGAAGFLSNEEIATRIYVSHSTVKTHVARAMTKLGARDRAQLVVIAYEAALVRPGWAKIELTPPWPATGPGNVSIQL